MLISDGTQHTVAEGFSIYDPIPNIHIPVPNLDMIKPLERKITTCEMRCQQDQKRHDPQHQDQRNGRNKEHPSSYPTAEDQMVWISHKIASPTPSSTCILHNIQRRQSKRAPPEDLD